MPPPVRQRGGPAKAAVLASAGNGVYFPVAPIANVVHHGRLYSIPVNEEKLGLFTAKQAGGLCEAASLYCGQIKPPLMAPVLF